MKTIPVIAILATTGLMLAAGLALAVDPASPANPCLGCHQEATPAIVRKWEASKHGKVGVKCYVCHIAETSSPATDPAWEEHRGFRVTSKVTPGKCEACHPQEYAEFQQQWSAVRRKVHGVRE